MTDIALARRNGYVFTSADRDEARMFIERWHYSHLLPSSSNYYFSLRTPGGLFGDRGDIVACCVFSDPIGRNAKPGEIELVRLARVEPGIDVPLSFLVSRSLRWLTQHTEYKLCISYADDAHGHHGGIYQACNFVYVGKSETGIHGWKYPTTGEVIHKRTAYDRFGTSQAGIMKHVHGLTPVLGTVKFLYVFPLVRGEKARARRIAEFGYEQQAYPKPQWPGGVRPDEG